jgi:hypothetical protein
MRKVLDQLLPRAEAWWPDYVLGPAAAVFAAWAARQSLGWKWLVAIVAIYLLTRAVLYRYWVRHGRRKRSQAP